MTAKEKFLETKSYEEFNQRREEFKGLKFDKDVLDHMQEIFPKPYGGNEELYKTPPEPGKKRIIGQ
ncbi:MAG: hypothetical protein RR466_00625 [Hungatella sp.]